MQDCPAFAIADQTVYSTASFKLASLSTMTGSFPPHSKSTGVMFLAQVSATNFAVLVEPVNANLFTEDSQRNFPVSPKPVMHFRIPGNGAISSKDSANALPTPGVNSLGLKTTVFPAESA